MVQFEMEAWNWGLNPTKSDLEMNLFSRIRYSKLGGANALVTCAAFLVSFAMIPAGQAPMVRWMDIVSVRLLESRATHQLG